PVREFHMKVVFAGTEQPALPNPDQRTLLRWHGAAPDTQHSIELISVESAEIEEWFRVRLGGGGTFNRFLEARHRSPLIQSMSNALSNLSFFHTALRAMSALSPGLEMHEWVARLVIAYFDAVQEAIPSNLHHVLEAFEHAAIVQFGLGQGFSLP